MVKIIAFIILTVATKNHASIFWSEPQHLEKTKIELNLKRTGEGDKVHFDWEPVGSVMTLCKLDEKKIRQCAPIAITKKEGITIKREIISSTNSKYFVIGSGKGKSYYSDPKSLDEKAAKEILNSKIIAQRRLETERDTVDKTQIN